MWLIRREQPVDHVWIHRVLVTLVFILSMIAGYYYTRYYELLSEYQQLENTKFELIELDVESAE